MRGIRFVIKYAVCLSILIFQPVTVQASDWPQFRGQQARGISQKDILPTQWRTENKLWETKLPGAGSSSPIVIGEKIFLTCYSGYGKGESTDPGKLTRHLICLNKKSGKIIWSNEVQSKNKEDAYNGFLTEHGYASSTPVSDGKSLFVFFGKSGAMAFDLDGKKLWEKNLGTESSSRRWGSAASPILYKDWVIINASDESQGLYALDKKTGEVIWKTQTSGLELCYTTPVLVQTQAGNTDLIVPVPGEVWGLNPENGKLRWYCTTQLTGNISPTAQVDGDTVYVFGGFRGSGSVAIKMGGQGDVTDTHILWESKETSYVASPLIHDGHLYWIDDRGQAHCTDAKSGKSVYRERLISSSGGRPVYASPVKSGEALFIPSRWQGVFVLAAEPKFQQLSNYKFKADTSDFNATPAISDDKMFIRSDQMIYCFGKG